MQLPKEVQKIINELKKAGFEAYAVGGCVRDFLLGREPDDWDITTNAAPDQIQKVFPKSLYENKFGTVVVDTGSKDPKLKETEITTYRIEEKYTDKRHPDIVKFAGKIEDDLARRDFTINAIALSQPTADSRRPTAAIIIDPFDGQNDLKKAIIRAVGDPKKRFNEDALRLMRAVRIATQLNFTIEPETANAIKENANDIVTIAHERIQDELVKIIMTENAKTGIEKLQELGLLKHIMPELGQGIGVTQNKHHIYTVWEHNLLSLDWAVKNNYNLEVRIAALLHDVAKPHTKKGEGPNSTFYNHEVVGAQITAQILERLKFPRKFIEKILTLVRWHLFYYNVGEVTERSVRRLVRNVGIENIDDLLNVRICDRKGSGVPKAEPYKLRHLRAIIEKVSRDPLSVKMLEINGNDIMTLLKIDPGPKIGQILNILLDEVIDDPNKNKKELLEKRVLELGQKSEDKLKILAQRAEEKMKAVEAEEEEIIKKKYRVG